MIRDEETSLSGAALQEIKSVVSLEEWEEKDTLLRFCKRQTDKKKNPSRESSVKIQELSSG